LSGVRNKGASRKSLESKNTELLKEIEAIADINSIGNPGNPLRWTTKSLRKITQALHSKGIQISHSKVRLLLKKSGFSLQSTRKQFEGKSHIDRDAQFQYINSKTIASQDIGCPVVSVDAKKKELVGNFINNGR